MKNLFFTIIFLTISQLSSAQTEYKIMPIDTTTDLSEANNRTWFKAILKDTIVSYKKVSVDSVICAKGLTSCDTVFFIQYYDLGWRYIGDTLIRKDSSRQQCGYYLKNERVGHWDLTDYPECFSEGTLITRNYYYYHGEIIPIGYSDKYHFLKDSISGYINTKESQINCITDSIYFSCTKDDTGKYNCSIKLKDGLLITKVPLKYLNDEVDLVLSGKYNREIRLNKNNH